jgi:hypothetical protein
VKVGFREACFAPPVPCSSAPPLAELESRHLPAAWRGSCRAAFPACGIGLFVDAIDEQAAAYCRRFGFAAAPDNPLLLFLPAASLDLE